MQFKTEALLNRNRDGLDVVVEEIISSYFHKAKDHLEFDEMKRMVHEMMPEIDKDFDAGESEVIEVIRSFKLQAREEDFDLDGNGSYDKSEVRNFLKLMLKYGWVEGAK